MVKVGSGDLEVVANWIQTLGGIQGSNPSPSSGESPANLRRLADELLFEAAFRRVRPAWRSKRSCAVQKPTIHIIAPFGSRAMMRRFC
jgi:hypothetical protein